MKVNTKSSPATSATRNIVSLKRFLHCTENEEDDFVLKSSMQSKCKTKNNTALAKDLETSKNCEEVSTISAVAPTTPATRNRLSLKRILDVDIEKDDFVMQSSMQPKLLKSNNTLAKDLELSTTCGEVHITSAIEGNALSKAMENGADEISPNIESLDKSLMVVETRKRPSPTSSSEVSPKCSRVSSAKVPHDVGFFIVSRSGAGPSNIASQPPHFMDPITSTPHDYNEPHRTAGATLRALQEVERLLLPRFIKDREEKLYREDQILKSFHEGILQVIQSCNDRFLREEKLLDEKVVSLQGWINRLQSEMETLQNERQNAFETTKDFQRCARAILQLVPSE